MSDDAKLAEALLAATPAGWRRPGFERPLAGLLFYTTVMLALVGPHLYLTTLVIPARVQPFPAVDGALATVDELALLGWALFDFGMTSAVVRAIAATRTLRPESVLPQLRLLLRWQVMVALSLAVAGLLVATWLLPGTRYAPLAYALSLRALCAPLLVFTVVPAICESLQRYDRQLLLELLDKRLLAVLVPIPIVLWARRHGDADGEAARALTGVVIGQALATVATGLVGLRILRGLGLPVGALLRGPGPSSTTRADLVRFGAGIMSGKAVFFLAGLVELSIVVARLADYPRWLGIKALVLGRLLQPMWLLWPFFESAVPSLAEALVAGRQALARSYVARYLQHGQLFVAALAGLALGAGPPLLRANLPPAWHAAADLLPLAAPIGLLLPLIWIGDAIQRASGKSYLNASFLLGEQLLRLVLLWILLPRLGLTGLLLATTIAATIKTLAVLGHAHRKLLSITLPLRSTFLAPILAGLGVGLVGRALVTIAPPTELGRGLAFLIAALGCFPLAFFLAGATGGLEPLALAELSTARELVPLRRITTGFLSLLLGAARLGARLSTHRGDHPLFIAGEADRQAMCQDAPQAKEMN